MKIETKPILTRFPLVLLEEIHKFQVGNAIANRSSAICELIRLGLPGPKTTLLKFEDSSSDSQKIPMRIPTSLLAQIDQYQEKNHITTRKNSIIELVRAGLTNTQI